MIYINYTNDYMEGFENNNKLPNLVKKIIFNVKAISGKFFIRKISNGELIVLPKISNNSKKNLLKYLKIYSIKTVCLSKSIKDKSFFEENNINVLDGKWLYKYLILNYIRYIVSEKESNINELEISFLVKKITELDLENIEATAKLVKRINVVTDSDRRIKHLADRLFKENGIVLNISKNYKKSLINSSIIINIDFSENEFNRFIIPRKVIVINIGNNIKINYKAFDGINILDYNVTFPEKYLNEDLSLDKFRKEVLYESFIYKNTSPKNIIKEIKNDNIYIESLVGQKGVIRKAEFSI